MVPPGAVKLNAREATQAAQIEIATYISGEYRAAINS